MGSKRIQVAFFHAFHDVTTGNPWIIHEVDIFIKTYSNPLHDLSSFYNIIIVVIDSTLT
jgi:hypothetical protein